MSSRSLFLRTTSALLLTAGAVTWLAAARPNDTIEASMKQVMQAMKSLGKGVTAETAATSLADLQKIEQALIAAKSETPDTAAAVDEKQRAEFVAEYRTTLLEALKFACDAEIAVVNGDYKEAESVIKTKLGALKNEGHDKFKGKDEKGPRGGR